MYIATLVVHEVGNLKFTTRLDIEKKGRKRAMYLVTFVVHKIGNFKFCTDIILQHKVLLMRKHYLCENTQSILGCYAPLAKRFDTKTGREREQCILLHL